MARRRSGRPESAPAYRRGVQLRLPHRRRSRWLLRGRTDGRTAQAGHRIRRHLSRRPGDGRRMGREHPLHQRAVGGAPEPRAARRPRAAVKGLTRNTDFRWGTHRSQLEYVWRSALGISAQGHLIYIAGNYFTPSTLAKALVEAHAVRGMQLDIHNDMVTANLFTPQRLHPGVIHATKLLPSMPRPATRYLQPDRARLLHRHAAVTQPSAAGRSRPLNGPSSDGLATVLRWPT